MPEEFMAQLPLAVAQLAPEGSVHEIDAVIAPDDVNAVLHAVEDGFQAIPLGHGNVLPDLFLSL